MDTGWEKLSYDDLLRKVRERDAQAIAQRGKWYAIGDVVTREIASARLYAGLIWC